MGESRREGSRGGTKNREYRFLAKVNIIRKRNKGHGNKNANHMTVGSRIKA